MGFNSVFKGLKKWEYREVLRLCLLLLCLLLTSIKISELKTTKISNKHKIYASSPSVYKQSHFKIQRCNLLKPETCTGIEMLCLHSNILNMYWQAKIYISACSNVLGDNKTCNVISPGILEPEFCRKNE